MEIRLLAVVFYLDEPLLEAVVDDGPTRRRINVRWLNRKGPDLPPIEWASMAEGEVKYQHGMHNPLDKLFGTKLL